LGQGSRFQRDVQSMVSVASAGPKIVLAIVGLGIGLAVIGLRIGLGDAYHLAGWVCLLVATGVAAGAWWLFPRKNLEILAKWFRYRSLDTSNSQLEWWVSIALAVTLGLMFLTAWWPLYFNIVYLIYCVGYFLGVRHLNNNIRWGLQHERECLASEQAVAPPQHAQINKIWRDAYDAIEHYHISRPHDKRVVIMGVAGLATLPLVILDAINVLTLGGFVASIVLAVTLIIAEVVISIWRGSYYRRMDELEEQRGRLEASHGVQTA
jgi:hypothetical protein